MKREVAVGVSSTGGNSAALTQRTGEQATGEQLQERERMALLQSKVAALESDLTALRSDHEARSVHGNAEASDQDAPGRSSQLTAVQTPEQRDEEEARIFGQIGQRFATQPVDAAWSTAMTALINEQLRAQSLEQSSVEKVECRSSLCRIEVTPRDGADLAVIRDSFRFHLANVMGSGASKRDETGRFIIYLATDVQALGMGGSP